jgi:hypothetical protein
LDHLHSFTIGILLVRPTKIAGEWISPVASKKATEKVEAVEAMMGVAWSGHVSVLDNRN